MVTITSPSPIPPLPDSTTTTTTTAATTTATPTAETDTGTGNMLGLGVSSTSSVLSTYPHLAHYIYGLLTTVQSTSPPKVSAQHPLSVSSSGESDDDRPGSGQQTPKRRTARPLNGTAAAGAAGAGGGGPSTADKEALVKTVVELLDNEEEEQVKEVLRPYLGELGKDDVLLEQVCLDCMHRRRDDVEHVPYAPHLTPTRARASPSVTTGPLRPFTPTRMPSFRARTPLGRPQSPSLSGATTPTFPYPTSALAKSDLLQSSDPPLGSPKVLSAKASSFNPSPRSVSAPLAAGTAPFSPSDPWRDVQAEPPRSASPFAAGPVGMMRTGSNLAIATPLFSDQSSPFHSPIGTPAKSSIKMPDVYISPARPLMQRTSSRGIIPDDDDDDEFSPFGSGLPRLHHQEPTGGMGLNLEAKPFEPGSGQNSLEQFGSTSTLSSSMPLSDSSHSYVSGDSLGVGGAEDDAIEASAGMTPLDVLTQVFTSLSKPELEDALHRSGYDFEGAMALLVSQHTLPRSGSSTPQRVSSPRPLIGVGSRGAVPTGYNAPRDGYFVQGGRTYSGNMSPGYPPRSPGPSSGGTRMCRYFLNGECRRSDCRFSHDLDRALCRFWLRGGCAKGPNCEFLHQLPNNFDPSVLSHAMSRVELSADGSAHPHTPPPGAYGGGVDEFPDLLAARLGRANSGRFDPSRNRFANAVKRAAPGPIAMPTVQVTGARFSPVSHPAGRGYGEPEPAARPVPTGPPMPKASSRIKLRPPTLLPTLQTGSRANEQYLSTRATAIRLGHARNACLARAADAFRRGDGGAAKRFSREGKALNERMLAEAAEAAHTLVRERRLDAQKAVRERDTNWSDDPSDRSVRGRECGGGMGVMLGVAGKHSIGGTTLSTEERTECMIDLHTLHGAEGTDILSQFLQELEMESYRGLAYIVVGEEKHVGTQDPGRGASKVRLSTSVKQYLADWGYAWNETGGVICVDPCRF